MESLIKQRPGRESRLGLVDSGRDDVRWVAMKRGTWWCTGAISEVRAEQTGQGVATDEKKKRAGRKWEEQKG